MMYAANYQKYKKYSVLGILLNTVIFLFLLIIHVNVIFPRRRLARVLKANGDTIADTATPPEEFNTSMIVTITVTS